MGIVSQTEALFEQYCAEDFGWLIQQCRESAKSASIDMSEKWSSASAPKMISLETSLLESSDSEEETHFEDGSIVDALLTAEQPAFDEEEDDVAYFQFLANGGLLEMLKSHMESEEWSSVLPASNHFHERSQDSGEGGQQPPPDPAPEEADEADAEAPGRVQDEQMVALPDRQSGSTDSEFSAASYNADDIPPPLEEEDEEGHGFRPYQANPGLERSPPRDRVSSIPRRAGSPDPGEGSSSSNQEDADSSPERDQADSSPEERDEAGSSPDQEEAESSPDREDADSSPERYEERDEDGPAPDRDSSVSSEGSQPRERIPTPPSSDEGPLDEDEEEEGPVSPIDEEEDAELGVQQGEDDLVVEGEEEEPEAEGDEEQEEEAPTASISFQISPPKRQHSPGDGGEGSSAKRRM